MNPVVTFPCEAGGCCPDEAVAPGHCSDECVVCDYCRYADEAPVFCLRLDEDLGPPAEATTHVSQYLSLQLGLPSRAVTAIHYLCPAAGRAGVESLAAH